MMKNPLMEGFKLQTTGQLHPHLLLRLSLYLLVLYILFQYLNDTAYQTSHEENSMFKFSTDIYSYSHPDVCFGEMLLVWVVLSD